MQSIKETCVAIRTLEEEWQIEYRARNARKQKIRYIDQLIDRFERLNLVDDADIPVDLHDRAFDLIRYERHPLGETDERHTVSEWMEALYDVQDSLMLPLEDETKLQPKGRG